MSKVPLHRKASGHLGCPVGGVRLLVSQEALQTAVAYVNGEMQDADSVQGVLNRQKERPRPQVVQ